MERFRALLWGRHVREQLIHSVRTEYEKTVKEIEAEVTDSFVHWPKSRTLCLPVFLGNKSRPHPSLNTETEDQSKKCYTLPEQPGTPTSHETQLPVVQASNVEHATRRGAENTHSSTEHPHDYRKESLAREDPPSRQTLPRESLEEEDGSCPSLSPLSSSPSSPLSLGEDTPNENNRNTCDIAAIQNEMGAHESEAPLMEQLLLHSGLLVAEGALPQDRQALLELKAQTEMELVWIKQAISSRQKASLYHVMRWSCD